MPLASFFGSVLSSDSSISILVYISRFQPTFPLLHLRDWSSFFSIACLLSPRCVCRGYSGGGQNTPCSIRSLTRQSHSRSRKSSKSSGDFSGKIKLRTQAKSRSGYLGYLFRNQEVNSQVATSTVSHVVGGEERVESSLTLFCERMSQ